MGKIDNLINEIDDILAKLSNLHDTLIQMKNDAATVEGARDKLRAVLHPKRHEVSD